MRILKEGHYETTVPEKGQYFLNLLTELQKKHPEIGDVDGLGLALRMEICEKDGYTPSRRLADAMFQRGLEGGIMLNGKKMGLVLDIGGYYKNVVTLAPSLDITQDEMNMSYDLLDIVLSECKQNL